jgi:hypothetical protein
MYAIIVKDSGNEYDVIGALGTDQSVRDALDLEWDKNLPIIGIDASNHKATATRGATWNGTSFDGTAGEGFFALTQEEKDAYRQYVFICDNKIIHRFGVETGTEKANMYDVAFAGEVFLVKCAFALAGQKVTYNQATREISAV